MKKKSLSILTLSSFLLLSSTTAFASTPTTMTNVKPIVEQNFGNLQNSISILKDNENELVVKEITTDGIVISTNNKTTNILTIEKYDISGENLVSTDILNLSEIQPLDQQIEAFSIDYSYQNTFLNREYKIYFHGNGKNNWDIRSKDRTKYLAESSSNRGDLEKFRDAVERLNNAEFAVISAVGFSAATTILTAFLTGGLGAGLAAAGTGTTVAGTLYLVNSAVSDADYYFNRLW